MDLEYQRDRCWLTQMPFSSSPGVEESSTPTVGKLELTPSQYILLGVLLIVIAATSVIRYQTDQSVNDVAAEVNDHFRRETGDRANLQREIITYAVDIERWVDGRISDEELALREAILERQRRIAFDEAFTSSDTAEALNLLTTNLQQAQAIIAQGPQYANSNRDRLDGHIQRGIIGARHAYDSAERESYLISTRLGVVLEQARWFQIGGAIVMLTAIGVLVASLRRMLNHNYDVASRLLRQENERYAAAIASKSNLENLTQAQAEVLELVATDTPLHDVLDQISKLVADSEPDVSVRFLEGSAIPDKLGPNSIALIDKTLQQTIGVVEWSTSTDTERTDHFEPLLQVAERLGSLAIARHLANNQLLYQANHDALTGLPNRKLLTERINEAVARAARLNTQIAVIFLDLDQFKAVNDTMGHRAGDVLITNMAERIRSTLRRHDTVARFGGDEFVILVEDTDTEAVCRLTERILSQIDRPVDIYDAKAQVSASAGVVLGDGESDIDELLRYADVAMYRAKHNGRSRYQIFDQDLRAWVARRHDLERSLRAAIDDGELEAWYQPVVDMQSGLVKGFEALVRWRRPDVGLVPPGDFISVAEEIGLVAEIDFWILGQAIEQSKIWRDSDSQMTISVNVSGSGLTQRGYAEKVKDAILVAQADPSSIILEITESIFVGDHSLVVVELEELREFGVRIAIDDFGTGYSSLQYLRTLPVDILKIDRTFVSSSEHTALADSRIVQSISELAHSLGLHVTAEGVESLDQARALAALGIEFGQGYLFDKPAPADLAGAHILQQFTELVRGPRPHEQSHLIPSPPISKLGNLT